MARVKGYLRKVKGGRKVRVKGHNRKSTRRCKRKKRK